MNLLLFWLGTIVVSKVMNFITAARIFRDIYGNGYKINFDNFVEMYNNITTEEQRRKEKIESYIPILNIFKAMIAGTTYVSNPDAVLNFFFTSDALEDMTKEEKEKYNEKPGFFRAMMISAGTMNDEIEKQKEKVRKVIRVNYDDFDETYIDFVYVDLPNGKIQIYEKLVRTNSISNSKDKNYSNFIYSQVRKFIPVSVKAMTKENFIAKIAGIINNSNFNGSNVKCTISEKVFNPNYNEQEEKKNPKAVNKDGLIFSDAAYDDNKLGRFKENLNKMSEINKEISEGKKELTSERLEELKKQRQEVIEELKRVSEELTPNNDEEYTRKMKK